ncbi:MAG: hypothetical protein JXX14_03210 [Deltaproteobacteria bacterium]|nr:hypothetical protein [Deltaproteobacteria bacterium]
MLKSILFIIVALITAGCGSYRENDGRREDSNGANADEDTNANADSDVLTDDDASPEYRGFYMSAAPMQYEVRPGDIKTVFDFSGFERQVDLVSLHMDFFGIPWQAFADGSSLPTAWVSTMEQIRNDVDKLNVGVFLSLTPLSGSRNTPSDNAIVVDGELVIDSEWQTGCADFSSSYQGIDLKAAYLNYVRWMVDLFSPIFLNLNIEMNKYQFHCPKEWPSMIELSNAAYDQEKQHNAVMPVFVSFELEQMWGFTDEGACEVGDKSCLISAIEDVRDISRDRFGISTYPLFLQWEWERMALDYFSAPAELTGEQVVFAETGWSNRSVTVPFPTIADDCFDLLRSTDEEQRWYMEFLLSSANELGADLVVWWTLRDFLPAPVLESCPCSYDATWCFLYEQLGQIGLVGAWSMWGGMGILNNDLSPKPSASLWADWKDARFREVAKASEGNSAAFIQHTADNKEHEILNRANVRRYFHQQKHLSASIQRIPNRDCFFMNRIKGEPKTGGYND